MSRLTRGFFFIFVTTILAVLLAAFYFFIWGSPLKAEEAKPDRTAMIARRVDATRQKSLTFIHKILQDPLLPSTLRSSILVKNETEEPKLSLGNGLLLHTFSYKIVVKDNLPEESVGECSVFIREDSGANFLVFLPNDDVNTSTKNPDWNKIAPQWDAFVKRHWSQIQDLKRQDDWRKAIRQFKPGRGVFTVRYGAVNKQGVAIATLSLDIRIADGKIGGISAFIPAGMRKLPTAPPPPTSIQISNAVSKALPEFRLSMFGEDVLKSISGLQIVGKERIYSRLDAGLPTDRFAYHYRLVLQGKTNNSQAITIHAIYDESKKTARVNSVFKTPQETQTDNFKPYTIVADTDPDWSHDGSALYFTTTRDAKARPWWQRDSNLVSVAIKSHLDKSSVEMSLIRPIKPLSQDFRSYWSSAPSYSGRYLVLTQGAHDSELFIIDTHKGVLYFPEPDAKARARMVEFGGRPEDIEPLRLQIGGASWLASENGLVLSLTNHDRDANLYVVRWGKDASPQEMELVPVVVELGEDVLPELSSDEKTLAWARKIYKRERDKAPGEKDRWQLHLADFDAEHLTTIAPHPKPGEIVVDKEAIAKANNSNRRTLDLPDEPLSLAWDETKQRWLVVTRTQTLWVREEKDGDKTALQVLAAPALNWNNIKLKPTSADVSRDGKIAIAGELETPKVYEKTECVVRSLIFLWDGQSPSVKPAYEPSLNGLPRFVFPSGSSWARIRGDAARLDLQGLADPAWFDGEPRTMSIVVPR